MRIPTYQTQVRRVGLPVVQAPQLTGAAAGAGLAEGLDAASRVAFQVAAERKERADNLAVMDAVRQFGEWQMGAIHGPQGAMSAQGQAAIGIAERAHGDAVKRVKELRDALANNRQKDAFERLATQDLITLGDQLNRHEAHQAKALDAAETDATLETAVRMGSAPGLTLAEREQQLRRGAGMLEAAGMRNSWGPETLENAKGKFKAAFHGQVLDQLSLTDPDQAMEWMEKHPGEIRPDDVRQFAGQIKSGRVRQASRLLADGIIAQYPDDIGAQRKAARQIKDAEVFDATMQRLDDAWRDHEQEIKVAQDGLLETVMDDYDRKGYLDEHSASFAKLKTAWVNKARGYDRQRKAEQRTQSAEERRIQTETDENVLADFVLMSDDDQAKVNLKADYRSVVSSKGFLSLVAAQNKAKERVEADKSKTLKAGTVTYEHFRKLIDLAAAEASVGKGKASPAGSVAMFKDHCYRKREEWEADPKNKDLAFDETATRAIIGKALLLGDKGGWHFSKDKYQYEVEPGEEWEPFKAEDQTYPGNRQPQPPPAAQAPPPPAAPQPATTIPPAVRQQLIGDFQAIHPGAMPSEGDLLRAYFYGLQKGRWQ